MPNKTIPANVVKVDDEIKFKTISINDTAVYSGKVIATCNYNAARVYGDVAATNLSMAQGLALTDPTKELPDVTKQKFIIVLCSDGKERPFSTEWVTSSDSKAKQSVDLVTLGVITTLRVYDISNNEANNLVADLRGKGYNVKLIQN